MAGARAGQRAWAAARGAADMGRKRSITRRDLIKGAVGVSAVSGLSTVVRAAGPLVREFDRPSILFVIADDWSWSHAGACGDKVIRTPHFDRVANEGVLFTNSFCAAPTCTASRGVILPGQAIHRLGEGANLWSTLSKDIAVYPDILEEAGYHIPGGGGPAASAGDDRTESDEAAGRQAGAPRLRVHGT